jgi:hypothetical protein
VPARLVLAHLPQMLADVVRDAFVDDADVAVDSLQVADGDSLESAVRRQEPDIVVVGLADPETRVARCGLLREHPGLIVLELSADARRAWLCELLPASRPLGEVSPDSLRAAVHDALDATAGLGAHRAAKRSGTGNGPPADPSTRKGHRA